MADIDLMLKWLEEFQVENEKLPFKKNDIRHVFFDFLYDIGNNYYYAYMMNDLMYLIKEKQVMFDKSSFNNYFKHFNKGLLIAENVDINQSYYNSLNRNLLMSTWSSFEISLTTWCEALATQEDKDTLMKWKFIELEKKLKKIKVSSSDIFTLQNIMLERHLSHVPVTRKIKFLYEKCNAYTRDKNNDLEFLKFFGEFRNTSHSNFIYYKKDDYTYDFKNKAQFTFKNNEVVNMKTNYEISPELYFDMLTELQKIWMELVNQIDHKDDIPYPLKEF